jgi:tetratricopeptide (TPR) repeat protein
MLEERVYSMQKSQCRTSQQIYRGSCKPLLPILTLLLTAIGQLAIANAQSATHRRPAQSELSAAVQQALAAEKQENFPVAETAWRKVVRLQPANAQAFAHLGLAQARQDNYGDAIASYRKARALNPSIPLLNLNLGLALFKSGNFKDAIPPFEAELKPSPNDQRLTILIGMAHYGAHQYQEAIPYLKASAARDPKNLALRLSLAHCYLWTKQFQAVLDVYQEILQINPDSAEADMIAGEALDEKGNKAGAEAQFRAAVKANSKEPNVHFGLAYLLWTQKRYDEAIPEFFAELANDPNNNQAMIYLGDTYVQTEQYDKARQILEKALHFQSPDPLIHLDLGIVYEATGDKESAIRELTKTIEMEPDFVNAHFRLAKLYQSMGRHDEAKAEFAKASSLNKKADKALYERISEGNARPETNSTPAQPSTPTQMRGSSPQN